jgi:hypothetical protein
VCWVHRIFKVACSLDSWACLNQKSWNFLFWIYFMAAFQDKIHFLPCWAFEHSHFPKRYIFHIIPLPPPPIPHVCPFTYLCYILKVVVFFSVSHWFYVHQLATISKLPKRARTFLKMNQKGWHLFSGHISSWNFFSRYFFNILNTLIVHCHILFKNSICARPCRFWIH